MRIVFSRDRPAQLDLLLRSLDRFLQPDETTVLWFASSRFFSRGYDEIVDNSPHSAGGFNDALRRLLESGGETVTFFCDDDIVFREVAEDLEGVLLRDDRTLSVCLYLGTGNVKQSIPRGFPHWEWPPLERHDFGFPCAVDGNTYRVRDVQRLMGVDEYENPTWLETLWSMRVDSEFAEERPMMAAFGQQSLVGVPVNRVSQSHGAPSGRRYPQETRVINYRFLRGERIDLDRLDFSEVDSCHHEIEFVWK